MSSYKISTSRQTTTPSDEPLIFPGHETLAQPQEDEPKEFAEVKALR